MDTILFVNYTSIKLGGKEVKGWKKIYYANANQKKKARVAILIADRTGYRARKNIRDKEGHYIVIKGSVLQDDIILNMYGHNQLSKLINCITISKTV